MKIVVIPATYNEKGNIEKLISILEEEVFPKIKGHELSILVADDNSPDGTGDVVKELMKKWENLGLNSGEKKGLGAAYIRSMTYAIEHLKADVVISIDADLQFDPHMIPKYLEKIERGNDVVTGTRYSGGGSMPPNWPIHRKAFSISGNLIVRLVTGRVWLHDWTSGFRAYRKEVFLKERDKLRPYSGYTFQVAALYKSLLDGYKVAEVPIHFRDRKLGSSKIAPLQYIVNLLFYVFKERFWELVHSPFLKYGITGFVGYIINAVSLEVLVQGAGLASPLAAFFSAELSIIWNFIVNNSWSFSHQKIEKKSKLFIKFLQFNLVSAGSLALITGSIWISTHIFGDTVVVRQVTLPLAIGFLVIPYSYSMYNLFIWKRWHVSFLSKFQNMVG